MNTRYLNTRHLVDAELRGALDELPSFSFSKENLGQIRLGLRQSIDQALSTFPKLATVDYAERWIPGPIGGPDVRVLIYTPKDSEGARPAYVHIHGGGYVMGFADMSGPKNAQIAAELAAVVVSVDYRLAPETGFPGNVEDCYAALRWVHATASQLNIDPNRIAVGGESAGGGLAAGVALMARDRKEVPLVHQHLIYPMIDDRLDEEPHPYTGEFVWNRDNDRFGWTSLLGEAAGRKDVSPYAAPARATELEGLPSTFLSVGALDLFLEHDLDYARRLSRAGVPVELHVYPGAFHGFDGAFESRLAKRHARDQMEALRAAFARGERS